MRNRSLVNRNVIGDTGIHAVTTEIERLRSRLDERSNEFEHLRHTHLKDADENNALRVRTRCLTLTLTLTHYLLWSPTLLCLLSLSPHIPPAPLPPLTRPHTLLVPHIHAYTHVIILTQSHLMPLLHYATCLVLNRPDCSI